MASATRGIVLVVEDEPLILLAAMDVIEEAGYAVLCASSADEAIAQLESEPKIQIVFTDVEMPGSMNGIKLAATIRDRWPKVDIIITSGRVPEHDVPLPERGVFLAKPYRPTELASQLGQML